MDEEKNKSHRDPELAVLLTVNAAIFVFALTPQGNEMFVRLGLFHVYGLLFLVLAFVRLFAKLRITDPAIRSVLSMTVIAMVVVSSSQVLEFFAPHVGLSTAAATLDAGNLYLVGQLVIVLAAARVLVMMGGETKPLFRPWTVGTVALFVMIWTFITVAFDPAGGQIGFTLAKEVGAVLIAVIVGVYGGVATSLLAHRIRILQAFGQRLLVAYLLFSFAALSALTEVVARQAHLSLVSVILDVRNLLFFAATALIFVALGKVQPGGVYSDLQAEKAED